MDGSSPFPPHHSAYHKFIVERLSRVPRVPSRSIPVGTGKPALTIRPQATATMEINFVFRSQTNPSENPRCRGIGN